MLIKLGWKNVWRNPVRSGVVLISVALGTWAGLFFASFSNGMTIQYIQDQLSTYTGHMLIEDPSFIEERHPEFYISQTAKVDSLLAQNPHVTSFVKHSQVPGLASSTSSSFGVTITGVSPEKEAKFSKLTDYLEEGDFFETQKHNPIVIGKPLARELDLKVGSKMVLNFQDLNNEITAGAFRVIGIFKSPNSTWDKNNVMVHRDDLNRLLESPEIVHEYLVRVDNFKVANQYADSLSAALPGLEVRSWGQANPELRYMDEMMDVTLYIFMIIIILALSLGILNTMLMVIMERTRELGMLMAIGMQKARIFGLIVLETLFLTLVGAPFGLILGIGTNSWFAENGINLQAFSEGLSTYGLSTIIYPQLGADYYINITILMALAAILAALYPSYKALKLKPVQAIRKV